jgi:hypothetical protein
MLRAWGLGWQDIVLALTLLFIPNIRDGGSGRKEYRDGCLSRYTQIHSLMAVLDRIALDTAYIPKLQRIIKLECRAR